MFSNIKFPCFQELEEDKEYNISYTWADFDPTTTTLLLPSTITASTATQLFIIPIDNSYKEVALTHKGASLNLYAQEEFEARLNDGTLPNYSVTLGKTNNSLQVKLYVATATTMVIPTEYTNANLVFSSSAHQTYEDIIKYDEDEGMIILSKPPYYYFQPTSSAPHRIGYIETSQYYGTSFPLEISIHRKKEE